MDNSAEWLMVFVKIGFTTAIYLSIRSLLVYTWRARWENECDSYSHDLHLYVNLMNLNHQISYHTMMSKFWAWSYKSVHDGWTPATYAEHLRQMRDRKSGEMK